MKDKYKEYINYIAKDIKPPYIHTMVNQYNLNEDEVIHVLSIIYDTPILIIHSTKRFNVNNRFIE